ncbi:Sulfate adenylyltransferase [Epichloe bromicola]|uniref:Sulfate adenylyltransferase n=1 Tax=Epichloe bromicola TaxID=79588 RepID=A0ABQ0CNX4_9HYPO
MRFSTSAIVAALPLLASAQQDPLGQYKAQFQTFVDKMGAYIPNPGTYDPVAALEAKLGSMKLSTLTLENWKETLYEPVAAGSTVPTEWWVLISGRNKTCFGHCGNVERAFNETAAKFAVLPGSPLMGIVNCDDQPILCNAWSAGAGSIWSFNMLPPPAPVEIYKKRLNLTTTTSEDLVQLQIQSAESKEKAGFVLLDSWFHPFNGKVTELGLSVPYGYIMWAFGLVPNWLFMLIVSFASRSMMSNRMQPPRGGGPGGPAAAAGQRRA